MILLSSIIHYWSCYYTLKMSEFEVEPGAARDSVLVASESFDNFEQMSSSLEEIKSGAAVSSGEDSNVNGSNDNHEEDLEKQEKQEEEEDVENSLDWTSKKKHIFVLSSAGKPIYSR